MGKRNNRLTWVVSPRQIFEQIFIMHGNNNNVFKDLLSLNDYVGMFFLTVTVQLDS